MKCGIRKNRLESRRFGVISWQGWRWKVCWAPFSLIDQQFGLRPINPRSAASRPACPALQRNHMTVQSRFWSGAAGSRRGARPRRPVAGPRDRRSVGAASNVSPAYKQQPHPAPTRPRRDRRLYQPLVAPAGAESWLGAKRASAGLPK